MPFTKLPEIKLTKRQTQIFKVIKKYNSKYGEVPSIRKITKLMKLPIGSNSVICRLFPKFVSLGLLKKTKGDHFNKYIINN